MLDFLYSDHERVAALMSQIEGVGTLVGYERSYQKEKNSGKSAEINIPIMSGSLTSGSNLNKELRQQYDPLWTNSKRLVEIVDERCQDRPSGYDYGDLVTVSGNLLCMDQGFLNELLKSDPVINMIAGGLDSSNPQRSPKGQRQEKSEMARLIRDFLQSLPLGIVFILIAGDNAFWFNAKREYLQIQGLDIPLKFPLSIGGRWHVTGLIDALPQDHGSAASSLEELGDKIVFPQAFTLIAQLITPLVGLFGRPSDAYGLSPVTIHREIRF